MLNKLFLLYSWLHKFFAQDNNGSFTIVGVVDPCNARSVIDESNPALPRQAVAMQSICNVVKMTAPIFFQSLTKFFAVVI